MQEEFQGGVTENVRVKCQRQTVASGCCTLDLFTQFLIKLYCERIQPPEWCVSQTKGIEHLMGYADIRSFAVLLIECHISIIKKMIVCSRAAMDQKTHGSDRFVDQSHGSDNFSDQQKKKKKDKTNKHKFGLFVY